MPGAYDESKHHRKANGEFATADEQGAAVLKDVQDALGRGDTDAARRVADSVSDNVAKTQAGQQALAAAYGQTVVVSKKQDDGESDAHGFSYRKGTPHSTIDFIGRKDAPGQGYKIHYKSGKFAYTWADGEGHNLPETLPGHDGESVWHDTQDQALAAATEDWETNGDSDPKYLASLRRKTTAAKNARIASTVDVYSHIRDAVTK